MATIVILEPVAAPADLQTIMREPGAGCPDCAPAPEARLPRSLQTQAAEARKLLA